MANEYDGERVRPKHDEVRAELEEILAGKAFENAGRAQEFLRFVVEETLAGRDDRLKGYTIAIHVFARAADFDAQADPLVRVEAGRLRRRLMEHYQGAGRGSALRIDLPRGCYVPRFSYGPGAAPKATGAATARSARIARLALLGAVLAVAALWAFAARYDFVLPGFSAAASPGAARIVGPKLLVLPFANLSDDRDLDYFAFGVTEEVIVRLGSFSLIVLADTTRLGRGDADPDLESLRAKFEPDYVLTGTVRHAGGEVRVGARLVDAGTGTQLWAQKFDARLDVEQLLAVEERLAEQVASTIGVPYGPLFEHEIARTEAKSAEHLDTYDCVLRFYYYAAAPDPERHADATRCFQRAVVREPQFADAWAGLSMISLAEHAYGYNRQPGNPIERARESAQKALDIDGNSRLANRAMLNVRFATRDFDGLDEAAARVIAQAPNDPSMLGLAGTLLAFGGQRDRGIALVDRALEVSPDPPAFFYLPYVFRDLEQHDYERALTWALKMDAPAWFTVQMVVAACAGLAGRDDIAQRSVARLRELYPDFAANARAELAKWYLDDALIETTVEGLRKAGLAVP
jgi:adenylate cyclase